MKLFVLILLAASGSLLGQPKLVDTTYHENGRLATVSWYTIKLSRELKRAEAFVRAILYGAGRDTVYIRDSIWVFGPEGERSNDVELINRSLLSSRSDGSVRLRPTLPDPLRGDTRIQGYVDRPLLDTVRLPPGPDGFGGDSVRVHVDDEWLRIDTLLAYRDVLYRGARLLIVPGPGSRRIPISVEDARTSASYRTYITVAGYDLTEEDFFGSPPPTATLNLRLADRRFLWLRLTGNRKLLSVSRSGALLKELPVGRILDGIDLSEWTAGEYLLQLHDLGTGLHTYARMRLD
ncbi:hypothetical protein CLV84_3185 [Neolewinella xylanilytica]|uniref:Secreted protein (Por secretion system target) n=1 Tax=Neolewinella xylanilytica TaxID=1514080 RepID=A0A2S6I542_9BACT|nr:hypothetical protein [Neolewinella xylanilytica]PPK86262.1 hypothetical protein CLV84_3185 [Neolewinella xylanilytica]